MPSTHPPIDPVDILPRTIRQTSDRINFGGTRVLVRELPSVGEVDVPGGISHFLFCYRPPETVGRMVIEHKGANYIHVADRSLPFVFRARRAQANGAAPRLLLANSAKVFPKADQRFFLAYDQFARLLLALLCLGDALAGDDNRS
jgi:hypothetical protein